MVQILKEEKFNEEEYVIREGEAGDKFYIVIEGNLVAEKRVDKGIPIVVMNYGEGDFFGELALINNEPRQASVKAKSVVKLACVSREGFKRVFGPLQEALKLKAIKYHE